MRISGLIAVIFQVYQWFVLFRVILSWVRLPRNHALMPLVMFVYDVTEPLLRPIRNVLRPYQGSTPFDFSPLALFFLIGVVESVILRLLASAGL